MVLGAGFNIVRLTRAGRHVCVRSGAGRGRPSVKCEYFVENRECQLAMLVWTLLRAYWSRP
jgi:hypothetical protein